MMTAKQIVETAYQSFDNQGLQVNTAYVWVKNGEAVVEFYNDPNRGGDTTWSLNYAGEATLQVEAEDMDNVLVEF